MSQENIIQSKFKENGFDATTLECTPSPVYYGFNCSPRQVKYYRLDKAVESILAGGFTKKSVQAYLEKVKTKMQKSVATSEGYDKKIEELRNEMAKCGSSQLRNLVRKRIGQVETRAYNYEYDTLDRYERAVEKLTKFLEE